ncbi:MAG: mucoidy inhibitor MuiA family protein, partial [Planctomycetes bacterium]|nr:mucoidy inhibitor MuiA family protein [Planctomycetota bacterium]
MSKETKTKPKHVRFFEDRAEVTRKAMVQVSDGRSWVRLSGATMLLDDRSVQASVNVDSVRVVSARVVRQWRTPANVEEVRTKRKEVQSLVRAMTEVNERLQRESEQRGYFHELMENWVESFAKIPLSDMPVADWESSYDALQGRDKSVLDSWLKEYAQLQELNIQQGSTKSALNLLQNAPLIFDCFIEVQLESSTSNEVEISVVYRTPCALWRPEHLARLHVNEKTPDAGSVELTSFATVWQNTGEDWKDIEVSFSTARPAAHASAPNIDDDSISRRKKTSEEKKQVVVQVREESVSEVGAGTSEMPGVDDGGVPLEFKGQG